MRKILDADLDKLFTTSFLDKNLHMIIGSWYNVII